LRSGLSKAADRILRGINNRLLKKFNYCWVPDHAEYPNLSGALGHPTWPTPTPVAYIGPLTRFHPSKTPEIPAKLTLVLSGPEPQRSLLEKKCLQELNTWKGRITLIRGLPTKSKSIVAPPSWKVYDHLPSDQLQQEIEEAEVVIARCGYSTLMDLCALNKKAILIPTPGQPEQTYLANWIKDQNLACCIAQDSDLSQLLQDKSTDIPVLNISVNKINNPSILIQSIDQLRSLHR
jgi:UDP-N-acetylglucosamine transferase subunit ALG13